VLVQEGGCWDECRERRFLSRKLHLFHFEKILQVETILHGTNGNFSRVRPLHSDWAIN
jgi:hypothetical protein